MDSQKFLAAIAPKPLSSLKIDSMPPGAMYDTAKSENSDGVTLVQITLPTRTPGAITLTETKTNPTNQLSQSPDCSTSASAILTKLANDQLAGLPVNPSSTTLNLYKKYAAEVEKNQASSSSKGNKLSVDSHGLIVYKADEVKKESDSPREELSFIQIELKRHINLYQMLSHRLRILGSHINMVPSDVEKTKLDMKSTGATISALQEKQKALVEQIRNDLVSQGANVHPVTHRFESKKRGSKAPKPPKPAKQPRKSKPKSAENNVTIAHSPRNTSSTGETDKPLTGFATGVSTINIQNAESEEAREDSVQTNADYEVEQSNKSSNGHSSILTQCKPHLLSRPLTKSPLPTIPHDENKQYSCISEAHLRTVENSLLSKADNNQDTSAIEFMAALDLVTPRTVQDVVSKRGERKRRVRSQPKFSYQESYYNKPAFQVTEQSASKRPKRKGTQDVPIPSAKPVPIDTIQEDTHDDACAMCSRSGELLKCDTCNLVYHLACLGLKDVPEGHWSCPKCKVMQTKPLKKSKTVNEAIASVQQFISTRVVKEEEKGRLLKKIATLTSERQELRIELQQLNKTIESQLQKNDALRQAHEQTSMSVMKISKFLRKFKA